MSRGVSVNKTNCPPTKIRLVGTTFEFDSFRAAFDQEVSHQLVGDVTCNTREDDLNISETTPHGFGIKTQL